MRKQFCLSVVPLFVVVTWLATTQVARAVFVEFDTFDALAVGSDINGQNGWVAPNGPPPEGHREVIVDPIHAGNPVVDIFESGTTNELGEGPFLWKSLGANSAPNADTSHTSYWRFMIPEYDPAASGFPTASFSLINGPKIDNGGTGMGSHVLIRGLADGTNVMQVRPDQFGVGGDPGFLTLDTASITGATLDTNTWYDMWMVTDNSADTFELYVQGGDYASQTQLQAMLPDTSVVTDITFRDLRVKAEGGVLDEDLDHFWIRPNADHNGHSILVDHMYLDGGENLATPAFPDFALPSLTVDRDTGMITLNNGSSTQTMDIRGYSITSESGALVEANWLSIADNYDSGNVGPNQVDADDDWTKLTESGSSTDLSEFQFAGDAGDLGTSFQLPLSNGSGAWTPTFIEDLEVTLVAANGDQQEILVNYVGNGGESIQRSDFNADGTISGADWITFITNELTDISSMTSLEGYLMGDVNIDGSIDIEDFKLFKADYIAEHGEGSFALMLQSVPEPSSLILLGLCGLGLASLRSRNHLLRI